MRDIYYFNCYDGGRETPFIRISSYEQRIDLHGRFIHYTDAWQTMSDYLIDSVSKISTDIIGFEINIQIYYIVDIQHEEVLINLINKLTDFITLYKVNWYFHIDDEDLEEIGLKFKEKVVANSFELCPYNKFSEAEYEKFRKGPLDGNYSGKWYQADWIKQVFLEEKK